jgi:hypothetical protein
LETSFIKEVLMHTLIEGLGLVETLRAELPWLMASMVIAEFFYKFHSFTLECVAFLATWYALSRIAAAVQGLMCRLIR